MSAQHPMTKNERGEYVYLGVVIRKHGHEARRPWQIGYSRDNPRFRNLRDAQQYVDNNAPEGAQR
jgi:hypothetical protein